MEILSYIHEPPAAYRASRQYIHSTDLYDEIVNGAKACGLTFAGPIDLKISDVIRAVPRYCFHPGRVQPGVKSAAVCQFKSGDADWTCEINATGQLVAERKPYDEVPLEQVAKIIGQGAKLTADTAMRPIEAVTALGVLLHKHAFPPASRERWMLGRLTLLQPLTEDVPRLLNIQIDRIVGKTMTRTLLLQGTSAIGSMIFVLAPS